MARGPAQLSSWPKISSSLLAVVVAVWLFCSVVADAARLVAVSDSPFPHYEVIYTAHTTTGYASSTIIRARLLVSELDDPDAAVPVAVKLINLPQPVLNYWQSRHRHQNEKRIAELQALVESVSRDSPEYLYSQKLLHKLSHHFPLPLDALHPHEELEDLQQDIEDSREFQDDSAFGEAGRVLSNELTTLTELCADPVCFSSIRIVRPLAVLLQPDCAPWGALDSYHIRTDVGGFARGLTEALQVPEGVLASSMFLKHGIDQKQCLSFFFMKTPNTPAHLAALRGIAFEYCDGGSLEDVIRSEGDTNVTARIWKAAPIFSMLAFSLAYTHATSFGEI